MLQKLGKLNVIQRLICIGLLFYAWIKFANYTELFRGTKGLIICTLVLALLAFLFLILIPDNRDNK